MKHLTDPGFEPETIKSWVRILVSSAAQQVRYHCATEEVIIILFLSLGLQSLRLTSNIGVYTNQYRGIASRAQF